MFQRTIFLCLLVCASLAKHHVCAQESDDSKSPKAEQKQTEDEEKTIEHLLVSMSVLGKGADGGQLGGIDLKELPMASMVVNREEMQRIKFVDPDEFLDRIPGETQVRNLRIPQGGKSYTIPLVDGLPLGSPYRGATQDITDVNSFDIDRIEITKGPASALYPSNAFGGTINVVTRTPPTTPELRFWGEAGEFSRGRTGAQAAGSMGRWGYFLDVNLQKTDGLRKTYVNDREQYSGKLVYSLSEQTTLSLRGEYIHRDEVFPGDLSQSEFDEDPTQIGRRAGSLEDIDSYLTSFKLTQLVGLSGELELGFVRRDETSTGVGRFSGPNDTELEDASLKLMYTHTFDRWDSRWTVGIERFEGVTDFVGYEDAETPVQVIEESSDSNVDITSIYTQLSISPTDKITLTAGVRSEEVDMSSTDRLAQFQAEKSFSSADPKLGVVYQITDQARLWLGYSHGFLTPDIEDLFIDRNANPDLRPEEGRNSEMGLRWNRGRFRLDTSVYHMDISNFIVTEELVDDQGRDFLQFTNAGKVQIEGVESVLEYQVTDRMSLGLTHTYSRNIFKTYFNSRTGAVLSGNRLSRSPEHHLNLRVGFFPTADWTTELEVDGYSGYYTNDDNAIDPLGKFERDPRINLRIAYRFGDWDFWAHGLNLTDTLEDRVGFSRGQRTFRLIDGRNLYAGFGYRF